MSFKYKVPLRGPPSSHLYKFDIFSFWTNSLLNSPISKNFSDFENFQISFVSEHVIWSNLSIREFLKPALSTINIIFEKNVLTNEVINFKSVVTGVLVWQIGVYITYIGCMFNKNLYSHKKY